MTMKDLMAGNEATEVFVVSRWQFDLPCSRVEAIV